MTLQGKVESISKTSGWAFIEGLDQSIAESIPLNQLRVTRDTLRCGSRKLQNLNKQRVSVDRLVNPKSLFLNLETMRLRKWLFVDVLGMIVFAWGHVY